MSNIVLGSKVLAGWFDDDNPEYWEITNLLDALRGAILANVVKQTETTIEEGKKLQEINEPVVWAFRELTKLKNEVSGMMKGGKQ